MEASLAQIASQESGPTALGEQWGPNLHLVEEVLPIHHAPLTLLSLLLSQGGEASREDLIARARELNMLRDQVTDNLRAQGTLRNLGLVIVEGKRIAITAAGILAVADRVHDLSAAEEKVRDRQQFLFP